MKKLLNTEGDHSATLISKSAEITGDVHFSGVLEIEGKICGNIYADEAQDEGAEVRIRESSFVQGEIRAPVVSINGVVEGDVYSGKHLELAAKSRVSGNVYYHMIEMAVGSEVNGSMSHRPAGGMKPQQLGVEPPAAAGKDSKKDGQATLVDD